MSPEYDAVIVGGGPAGLSAALVLGRCRRSVLVIDSGRPRNHAARRMHNFISRDGLNPAELLALGRQELEYYGVRVRTDEVVDARCGEGFFELTVASGLKTTARTLLLATGVRDELPAVVNIREFYGLGVHHCPYCDAWEYKEQPIAAYGLGRPALGLARSLLTWTPHVTIVTNGRPMSRRDRQRAMDLDISVREDPIARLQSTLGDPRPGEEDALDVILFEQGPPLHVTALFFNTDQQQRSALPQMLGCRLNKEGGVVRDRRQRTAVKGLYLAGDASRDVQFVIVAAAEGAKAGLAMNAQMQEEDLAARLREAPRA